MIKKIYGWVNLFMKKKLGLIKLSSHDSSKEKKVRGMKGFKLF